MTTGIVKVHSSASSEIDTILCLGAEVVVLTRVNKIIVSTPMPFFPPKNALHTLTPPYPLDSNYTGKKDIVGKKKQERVSNSQ